MMDKLEDTHWWFIAKRGFIESLFPKAEKLRILDIGAGTGGTTDFLKRYGVVVGLENSPLAIKLARAKGLKIIKGNAQKLPFEENLFDIVTIFDVLYHQDVKSDIKVIKEAHRVLKKGGVIIITDSTLEFLRSGHDKVVHTRHRYTSRELKQKVERGGFRVEKSSYIFFFVFPMVFISRMIGKFSKKEDSDLKMLPKFINKALISLCSFEALFLKYLNLPIGSSLIIRAKKR